MDALLLELRTSIEAVQGYVSVQEKTTVKIHKNKLEITSKDNVTRNHAFKHFTVQPNSCKGLRYVPNEGLHFRMALGAENLAKQQPTLSSEEDVDSQLLCDYVSFYCATCGHCITGALKFNRVLPLPSENWQETCSNMFCHGDYGTFPTSGALNPKADDCFTSDTDYILHASVLEMKTPSKCTIICCTRCNGYLGDYKVQNNATNPSNTVTLSRHCVLVKSSGVHIPAMTPKLNNRRWIENWIACHLVKSSKENFCHRLIIKEQGNHTKHYACVWLLCPNTFIMCNTYPEPSTDSEIWQNFTWRPEDVPGKHLEMYQTVKVLYKCASDKDIKKLLDDWIVDSKVHSLYLQQRLCLMLLLILTESNASLPPSLQYSNGFKNGYLRYSSEHNDIQ